MTKTKLRTPLGLSLAVVLTVLAAFVGLSAVRTTAIQMMSSSAARTLLIAADQPELVLGRAMGAFVARRGSVPSQSLPSIKLAAARLPLDARPYLLMGSSYLGRGDIARATAAFEAGRRLDPRQRWIHVLLLDRYLRAGQYNLAADEFAVLARLVGAVQSPIAGALAQMSVAPQTRDAVRQTLRQDASLEQAVLTSLASSDVEPSLIFAMASPTAMAAAATPGNWGPVLVDRLVTKGRYQAARQIWQRINRLTDQQVAPLLYDAGLQTLAGAPPFNWKIASDNVAAVELRGNRIEINYYGRETGELVSQLLLLPPGRYRFGHIVSGSQREPGPMLFWSITCEDRPQSTLARLDLSPISSTSRRIAVDLVVPDNCSAQRLRLAAQAGEFPVPMSATIGRLVLQKAGGQ